MAKREWFLVFLFSLPHSRRKQLDSVKVPEKLTEGLFAQIRGHVVGDIANPEREGECAAVEEACAAIRIVWFCCCSLSLCRLWIRPYDWKQVAAEETFS